MAEHRKTTRFPPADYSGFRADATGLKAMAAAVRTFGKGATRDIDIGKNDFEAFLSPTVLEAYGRYMTACRTTATGLRDGDNWQKGIPFDAYMKSNWRHFFDLWKTHRGGRTKDHQIINCMAVLFNTMGYAHELLKATAPDKIEEAFERFINHRSEEIATRAEAALADAAPKPTKRRARRG